MANKHHRREEKCRFLCSYQTFEMRAPRLPSTPDCSLIDQQRPSIFLVVTTFQNEDDAIPYQFEKTSAQSMSIPSFIII